MLTGIIVVYISLIIECFLFKADTAVGPACIKPTDEYLDKVLKAIDNKEQNPQGLYLLIAMSSLMSVHSGCISLLGTIPDEYPRKDCKSYVALKWNDV